MSVVPTSTVSTDPPTLGSAFGKSVVTVEIGVKHRKYYVHRALLAYHSEYFQKPLAGLWKEAQEGLIVLEDIEPATFNVFVHWLYIQQLPELWNVDEWDSIMETNNSDIVEDVQIKAQAYCFGDFIIAPGFRRAMNKAIVDAIDGEPASPSRFRPLIDYMFANIPSDRPVLQLLVDEFINSWDAKKDDADDMQCWSGLPRAFVTRMLVSFSRDKRASREDREKIRCYLEHGTEAEKKNCRKLHFHYEAETDSGCMK